jgi:hypothetical protein
MFILFAIAKVDKYGRKLKPQSKENEMKRFYRLDEDEDFEAGSDDDEDEVSSDEEEYKTVEQLEKELEEDEGNFEDEDEESGDEDEDEDEDEFKPRYDPMRGEGVLSSSESEDEGDEAQEEEEEEDVRIWYSHVTIVDIYSYAAHPRSQPVTKLIVSL